MKRLLAALDLTAHADRAFQRATLLAREHAAELTLVHVIDETLLSYDDDGALSKTVKAKAARLLERYTTDLAPDEKAAISSLITIGKAWEEILSAADRFESDLIVIGLHHVTPVRGLFVGTTAERLIRRSTRPVLMVRDKAAGEYRQVIAATDFSTSSAHALSVGLEIAPEAEFTLLHVYETPFPAFIRFSPEDLEHHTRPLIERAREEAEEAMEAFRRGHGALEASLTPLLERGEIVPGIARIVEQKGADLLVMGTHGGTGLVRAMMGSVALTFLNDPPCDVLVTR
jgi:nucleotide-binding universal stress UspA family protein